MATATIALVSESLAAGDGRQLVGVSRGPGQGAEGPWVRGGLIGPHTDPFVALRHAGRGRSGRAPAAAVAVASGWRNAVSGSWAGWAGCRRPQLSLRGAVLALLRLDDRHLGGRRHQGAVTPAPGLRDCARVGGRGRGGPMAFALRGGAQRSGFPILLPHAGGQGHPPTSFEQSFCPWLCWRTRQSVPSLVADLVGILRLC